MRDCEIRRLVRVGAPDITQLLLNRSARTRKVDQVSAQELKLRRFQVRMASRYLPPIAGAVIIYVFAERGQSASELFAVLAQVAPVLLLAALIEGNSMLASLISTADRLSDSLNEGDKITRDSLEHLEDLKNLPEGSPDLEAAATELRSQLETTLKLRDGILRDLDENFVLRRATKRLVSRLYIYGIGATAAPIVALASDSSSPIAAGLAALLLGLVASHMYSLYMHRFEIALYRPQ